MTSAIAGPQEHSAEWMRLRTCDFDRSRPVVFGASRAAAVCGVSPYDTPLDEYLLQRREKPARDATEVMEFGTLVEPVILELYRRRADLDERALLTDVPMYFHGEHSFMSATPDAIVLSGEEQWGVDAKSSTDHRYSVDAGADDDKFGREGTDYVPIEILFQCQQQMEVMGWPRVDIPVLFGRKLRTYTVNRNESLIAAIVAAEQELAQRIIDAEPPEPHWTHPNTRSLLQELHGLEPDKVEMLDVDDLSDWLQYQALGEKIKCAEEERAVIVNHILHKMGDAQVGRFPAGKKELRRSVVADKYWTPEDVDEVASKVGSVKRRGFESLRERKVK